MVFLIFVLLAPFSRVNKVRHKTLRIFQGSYFSILPVVTEMVGSKRRDVMITRCLSHQIFLDEDTSVVDVFHIIKGSLELRVFDNHYHGI